MEDRGREQSTEWSLFNLIIVGIVAGIILVIVLFVVRTINSTSYWQTVYARDLGMATDMLMASRGQVELRYDFSKVDSQLVMIMTEGYVMMNDYDSDKGKKEYKESSVNFHYAKNLNHPIFNVWKDFMIQSKYFTIYKDKTTFQITEDPLKNIPCENINTTKDITQVTIYVGFEDSTNVLAKGITPEFKQRVIQGLTREGFNVAQASIAGADMGILIKEKNYVQQELMEYTYTGNMNKADKARCLIQNELIKTLNLKGYNFKKMTQNEITKMSNPSVGLIITSNQQTNEFADSIVKGVVTYFRS